MAACGSFAGLLLLCECDWLTGRTPPKTSFEVQLPSGAGVDGGRVTVGFYTDANNSAWLLSSHLVELIWYFMVEAVTSDHSHGRLAGERLKLGNIP